MVPYLRAANVSDGQLNLDDVKEMNFTPNEQSIFGLRPGDVLITEGSGSLRTVGASAVWQGEVPGTVCFQNTLLRLRPKDDRTDSRFLAWWSRASFADGLYASIASGANIFHISADRVRALPLHCPPLDEQRRIADFLDAETARIDGLQDARDRQLATLDELVASRVSALIPKTTETPFVRLGYLSTIQSGITVDSNRDPGPDAVTLPYLRVANVQDGHLNLESITEIIVPRLAARSSTLRRGDVLMTEGGDLDKLGRGTVWNAEIGSCLHQNHVFAVRPNQAKLTSEYLALITRTAYARSYFESTGTKTTNLASTSSSKIRDFRVPLIDLENQARIVRETDTWLADVSKIQSVLTLQRSLLAERRQALITAAVTGGITV